MKLKKKILKIGDNIKKYLGSDSIYEKNKIDVGKLVKTYTTYGIVLSILISVFAYKFTKTYYEYFNYRYFQRQDKFDIYWFTFTRLELIETLLDPVLIFALIIIGGMASYEFIYKKVNHKENTQKTEVEKWKVIILLGYIFSFGFVVIPYVFVAYSIGGIDSALTTFIFLSLIIILCLAKKEYLHSFYRIILLSITVYYAGKQLGNFFGKEAKQEKARLFLKENNTIHLNYLDSKKDSLLYQHKYIIGENTTNYIIYNEKEGVFEDIKKSRITSRKIKKRKNN